MRIMMTATLTGLLLAGSAYAGEPSTDNPALWGSPTVYNGACCKTLGEVRTNIDRIDHEIIKLMAERGHYVYEAARFKPNPEQVQDSTREDAIVHKAMAIAEQDGLSPKVAETTYRAMLRAFVEYEQGVFSSAAASGNAPWKDKK
jgi:isochorismate pyruvate lyase